MFYIVKLILSACVWRWSCIALHGSRGCCMWFWWGL